MQSCPPHNGAAMTNSRSRHIRTQAHGALALPCPCLSSRPSRNRSTGAASRPSLGCWKAIQPTAWQQPSPALAVRSIARNTSFYRSPDLR